MPFPEVFRLYPDSDLHPIYYLRSQPLPEEQFPVLFFHILLLSPHLWKVCRNFLYYFHPFLSDKQIDSIKSSINTFRAFNAVREQVPPDLQKLLDEFIEMGTWNGKPVFLEE